MKKKMKKSLSVFLSFLMVMTSIVIAFTGLTMTADAAVAGSYRWWVEVTISNGARLDSGSYVRVYGKHDNGTGSEEQYFEESIKNKSSGDPYYGKGDNSSYDGIMDAFPSRVEFNMVPYNSSANIKGNIKVYACGTWQAYSQKRLVCDEDFDHSFGVFVVAHGEDHTWNKNFWVNQNLPTPVRVDVPDGPNAIRVPEAGAARLEQTYATFAWDQYDAEWYQDPVLETDIPFATFEGKNLCVDSRSNLNKDYIGKIRALLPGTDLITDYININVNTLHTINFSGTPDPMEALKKYTGEEVTLAAGTKRGYTFNNWYLVSNIAGAQAPTINGDVVTVGTSDAILGAKFTPNTYNVTLSQADATINGTTSVRATFDANMPAASMPRRDGYTLKGYYANSQGTGFAYYDKTGRSAHAWDIDHDTTLYPVWLGNPFSIKFDANTGSGTMGAQSANYNSPTTLNRCTFFKTGNKFLGWTYTPGGDIAFNDGGAAIFKGADQAQGKDITLYAKWQRETYTLNVVVPVGASYTGQTTYTGEYRDRIDVPTPTMKGYTFLGWTVDNGTMGQNGTYQFTDASATLTANFSINTYTLNVNVDSDTSYTGQTTFTGHIGDRIALGNVEKAGFDFLEWKFVADTSSTGTFETENGVIYFVFSDGDATITPRFSGVDFKLTLDANGGSLATDNYVRNINDVVNLVAPVKPGSTFSGWKIVSGLGTLAGTTGLGFTFTFTNSDCTLQAQWDILNYTITVDAGEGTYSSATYVDMHYGDVMQLGEPIPPAGYRFDRWTSSVGHFNGNDYIVGEGNDAVTAVYTAIEYTVTIKDGDTPVDTVTGTVGQSVALPTLTKHGYDFKGYTVDKGTFDADSMRYTFAVGDATATAIWEVTGFYLKVDAGDGYYPGNTTIKNVPGTTITLQDPQAPDGYSFVGWSVNAGTLNGSEYTYADSDAVAVAVYESIAHTVTIDRADGITLPKTVTMKKDGTAILTGDTISLDFPTKPGYTFGGWKVTDDNGKVKTYYLTIGTDENVTVTAQWTENTYNVDYRPNGAKGKMAYDALKFTESGTVKQCEYDYPEASFVEWNTKKDGTGMSYKPGMTLLGKAESGTFALYAIWKTKDLRLTVDANGGVYTGEIAVMGCENDSVMLETPTKDGYVFDGWTATSGTTQNGYYVFGSEDAVITAKWISPDFYLTLDLDGGTSTQDLNLLGHEGESIALVAPTKDGSVFAGWKLTDGDGSVIKQVFTFKYSDAVLVAQWAPEGTDVNPDDPNWNQGGNDDGQGDGGQSTGKLNFIERIIVALRRFFKMLQDFFRFQVHKN